MELTEETNKEKYKAMALEAVDKYKVFERLSEHGKPLFLMLSGSHNFGFPSKNSDIDIRGVYIAPTIKFLGIRDKLNKPTITSMSEDRIMDVSIDEIGHYFNISSKPNGHRLEWINSNLVFYSIPEFKEFKKVVNSFLISKELLNPYLHSARDFWSGKAKLTGIKKDLYTLKSYMTGITILEDGKVISDINENNKKFKFPIVDKLVELKKNDEFASSEGYNIQELSDVVKELDSRLLESVKQSSVPEKVNLVEVNNYLIRLRLKNIKES